ncbi:MAG: hypothetical protein M3349_04465 [Actinomycetota bacterium]|nr:hypothetical protein [Actinomycetota bacterium]
MQRLAAFYADITGGQVTYANADWAVVNGPGGRIDFQTVTDHRPPTWPEATSPVHLHLDFYVGDLAAAEAPGARRRRDQIRQPARPTAVASGPGSDILRR